MSENVRKRTASLVARQLGLGHTYAVVYDISRLTGVWNLRS